MNIQIRLEEKKDYRRVEEITREAFFTPDRMERGGIGCPTEHWMVHALREKDGILELSYVAEVDSEIVGHVIYSHAHIETKDGKTIPVLNFGPLSVKPKYQRKGVGNALMKTTIPKAKDFGYGAILFFGHPEYYPRFGFVEAKQFGITTCHGENFPAFMAMELKVGYLDGVHGKYHESPIYDDRLNAQTAKDYDIRYFRQEILP